MSRASSSPADVDLLLDKNLPPDGGILCYVLRTGFGSSQGELMRMIQFSQETVEGNKKETLMQLAFLLFFAMIASGYVLYKGLQDPERPTYKVLLRCILILTQVVPSSLPMQTAFAVHQALMNLNKVGIYCTEPFRVPLAGKVKYLFFDKTGTLTADQMIGTALVIGKDAMKVGFKDQHCGISTDSQILPPVDSASYKDCLVAMKDHKETVSAFVLVGCTALTEVNGALCGDPIEIASLKGVEWSYLSSGMEELFSKQKAIAAADKNQTQDTAVSSYPCFVPGLYTAKQRALTEALDILARETTPEKKIELKKDIDELQLKVNAELSKGKSTSVEVLVRHHFASSLQRMSTICKVINNAKLQDTSSQKSRNSGGPAITPKYSENYIDTGLYAMVKGSPEKILTLLDPSQSSDVNFIKNFNASYRSLAQQGHRVLALAYKKLNVSGFNTHKEIVGLSTSSKINIQLEKQGLTSREKIENNLFFAGFASYRCETRKDSSLVIQSLNQSSHSCVMLTGDAALTAFSVALEVCIAERPARRAMILSDDASCFTSAMLDNKGGSDESKAGNQGDQGDESPKVMTTMRKRKGPGEQTTGSNLEDSELVCTESGHGSEIIIPFTSPSQLNSLPLDENRDLVLTGKSLSAAEEKFGDEIFLNLKNICVFARLSPQQKENIIRAVGGHHFDNPHHAARGKDVPHPAEIQSHTLMCGDGGNDVGALKQACVGVALLSGFGNANVDTAEKKNAASSDFFSGLFGDSSVEWEQAKKDAEKKTGYAIHAGSGSSDVVDEDEDEGKKETRALAKQMMAEQSAEDRLAALKDEETKKQTEISKKMQEELKKKQSGMLTRQQGYVEEELEKRRKAGLEITIKTQMGVMQEVMRRMKEDMENDRKVLQKQHGLAGVGGKWTEGLEKAAEEGFDQTQGVRLGDASIAAPFTSRAPSIMSVVQVIRQGRCTLLSGTQQMSILMIDSMITAFSLSMMSAEGTRPAEQQMMASGTLLSIASIAFSWARPLDRMHPVRPLSSVFHPALFSSLLGQLLIHLSVMVFISYQAKQWMGEEELAEVLKFEKERNHQIAIMELEGEMNAQKDPNASWFSAPTSLEDAMWFSKVPFRPNLLNTCVWLTECAQQVSVLFCNYRGSPWMLGMLDNQPLFISLIGAIILVWVCASNMVPTFNNLLKLAPVPEELKIQMILCLVASLVGCFIWDRVMHIIFAPEIWQVMWTNIITTRPKHFIPLGKTLGIAGAVLFVLSTGNLISVLGMGYLYKQYYSTTTSAGGGVSAATKK